MILPFALNRLQSLDGALPHQRRVRLTDAAVERKGREGRKEILSHFASFADSALFVTFSKRLHTHADTRSGLTVDRRRRRRHPLDGGQTRCGRPEA